MAARIQREISLLVISLIAAVISLPMAASVALAVEAKAFAPVTQMLKAPVRIALDGDGTAGFYVTDPRSRGVLKYNAAGSFVRLLKTSGVPQGVAVLGSGHVMGAGNLVVSMGSYTAIVDKVTGLDIKRLGTAGVETVFGFADGVAIDGTGAIFVADAKSSRVAKFNANGEFLKWFGTFGDNGSKFFPTNNGNFYSPAGVAYDSANNRIAVTDVMLSNVKFFSTDGVPQGIIGTSGPEGGNDYFVSPMGITFEYAASNVLSRMYVVDSFQSAVKVLNAAGAYEGYVGDYGPDNGKLVVPSDAVYDKINRRLIVVNGYGNISIYGIDGGKNPLPSSTPAPPTLSVNQPLSIVNSSSLSLSGTVSALASVSCSLNGVKAFPATVNAGNWDCSVSGLGSGGNSIDVVARNASPVEVKQNFQVTYALGGPNLTVTPVTAYVKVTPLPVSGTVDAGSTVQICNLNPTETCYAATVDGANWSYPVPVVAGPNEIKVKATKGATSTATVSTVYDNSLPVLTLSTVPTGSTVARQVVNISGTVTDSNLAGVTVDGQQVAVVGNRFSYPVVGKTSIPVVATDLAGNEVTQTINLNYNPSMAPVDFTSHADGAIVQSTPQTITGTYSGSATVFKVNGQDVAVSGGAWSKSIALTKDEVNNGVNTIVVEADGSKSKLTLIYDPTTPAVAVTNPGADKAVRTGSITVAGTVGDGVLLTNLVNGVDVERASGIPFALSLPQEGVYPVIMKAKDVSGATSQTVRNIIYDITPPELIVPTVPGEVTTITGTAEPGAVVKVLDLASGQPIANATVVYTPPSSWTATLSSPLKVDNIDISATDAADNVTSKTLFRPDGNINIDPTTDLVVNDLDANACMEIVVGLKTATRYQIAHGDIGPLDTNGLSSPNGRIDVADCILILRKASGLLVSW